MRGRGSSEQRSPAAVRAGDSSITPSVWGLLWEDGWSPAWNWKELSSYVGHLMHRNLCASSVEAVLAAQRRHSRQWLREQISPSALTWEEDPADHARHYHHEEGQNLQVGGHQGASLGMREGFSSKGPLHNDLGIKRRGWSAVSREERWWVADCILVFYPLYIPEVSEG